MNAVELERVVAKSGRSARSLSIALGKDASYISSMIKRGYEIPASVAKKLKDLIAGKEVPSFDFKAEDFDSARLREAAVRRQQPLSHYQQGAYKIALTEGPRAYLVSIEQISPKGQVNFGRFHIYKRPR